MTLIKKEAIPAVALTEMNDVHYEEIVIINQLHDIVISGSDNDLISEKLLELKDHTVAHFANEERLMQEHGFPPYPIHKYNHDMFLNEFALLVQNWESTKDTEPLKVFLETTLPEWLHNHISTLDTVTAMFLNEKIV
jgi:hemerythrin